MTRGSTMFGRSKARTSSTKISKKHKESSYQIDWYQNFGYILVLLVKSQSFAG
jgi:hypothetical protein